MASLSVDQTLSKAKASMKSGALVESENLFRLILEKFPENRRALAGLNEVLSLLQQQGKLEPAPAQLDALFQLYFQGHFNELGQKVEALLITYPRSPSLHTLCGAAYAALRHFDSAIRCYQYSLHLKPDNYETHFNLAVSLREIGEIEEAIESYKRAIKYNPNYAEAYSNLGKAYHDFGTINLAHDYLKKAIALKPRSHISHFNLANLLLSQGEESRAEGLKHLKIALEINPGFGECYRIFAMNEKLSADDPLVATMRQFIQSNQISGHEVAHLNFALGKVEEGLGNLEASFRFYKQANYLRKTELNYKISDDVQLFESIKNFFKNDPLPDQNATRSKLKSQPIFVLGMPRSGTTLCEQIISSHSRVFGAGELETFYRALHLSKWEFVSDKKAVAELTRGAYAKKTENLSKLPFFTDKMPMNFRWIGFILQSFPEVKIVHTVRNPVAVCWSNFQRYFPASGMSFTFDLKDVAQFYLMYTDLMAFWHQKFPGRIYDLSYEKLTENQEEETRKLFAYLGLDWEDKVLDFHKSERSVRTASNQQVRKKMYKGSSEEWKKYEPWLGEMLEILKPVM